MTGSAKFLEEIAKKDALTVILAMSASFECMEVVLNLSLYKYEYSTVKIPLCSEKPTPILKLLC